MAGARIPNPRPSSVITTEVAHWFIVQIVLGIGLIACMVTYVGLLLGPFWLFGVNFLAVRERARQRGSDLKEWTPIIWAGVFNACVIPFAMNMLRSGAPKYVDWVFVILVIVLPSVITWALLTRAGLREAAISVLPAAIVAVVLQIVFPDSMGVLAMVGWNFVVSIGLWCWSTRITLAGLQQNNCCSKCGYPRDGLPSRVCPECGDGTPQSGSAS